MRICVALRSRWMLTGLATLAWLHALSATPQEKPGFFISGKVTSGNAVIPGATVTAIDAASGEKYVGWTGVDGRYGIRVTAAGTYHIRAEMIAFQAANRDVTVSSSGATADLTLTLLSQVARPVPSAPRNPAARGGGANRGFQGLSVMQGEGSGDQPNDASQIVPSGMPVPGLSSDAPTESVAFSGNESAATTFGMSTDEAQQ